MNERIKSFYKKLTHFGLASVLAFSSMAMAMSFLLSDIASAAPTPASETEETVYQSDFANAMNTWTYHDDTANTASPASTPNHQIDTNPTPEVGDSGAVRLDATASGQRWNLASLQYSGTKLSDIASLGFSVYTNNPGSAYINLDVDFNHPSISGWQGRLVYVPNGVSSNEWSAHEAVASNANWRWSNMITSTTSEWPDGDDSQYRSWEDIVAAFPDATVTAVDDAAFGGLYLRADGVSTTYYDHVYLATNSQNVSYNFELDSPIIVGDQVSSTDQYDGTSVIDIEVIDSNGNGVEGINPNEFEVESTSGNNFDLSHERFTVEDLGDGFYKATYSPNEPVDRFWKFYARGILIEPELHVVVTIDETAPEAPVINSPGQRTWHKTTPIANSWDAVTDDSGIDYYQIAYNYDDGHSFGGVNTCEGDASIPEGTEGFVGCRDVSGLSRSHTPTVNEQGGVTIWVRAVDNAGNVGPWSSSHHYYYDSIDPETDITVSSVDDGIFTVSGNASDNLALNRVYVQLVHRESGDRFGGTTINLIPEGNSASWSRMYDLADSALELPEGNYAAHASVVDRAGNSFSTGWTEDFLVNAPVVPPEEDDDTNDEVTEPEDDETTTANEDVETQESLPITPLDQTDEGEGVLGDQDDQTANTEDDENTSNENENGASDENGEVEGAVDEDEDGNMTLFGLAWYWWLLVLAGVAGAWYLLGAWRNRSEQ